MNNLIILTFCLILSMSGNPSKYESRTYDEYIDIEIESSSLVKEDTVFLEWKAEKITKVQDGFEFPFTELSLELSGGVTRSYYVGEFLGVSNVIEDLEKYGFESNTLTACQIYYAGGGTNILVAHSEDMLEILMQEIPELGPDDEITHEELTTIALIEIPDGVLKYEVLFEEE